VNFETNKEIHSHISTLPGPPSNTKFVFKLFFERNQVTPSTNPHLARCMPFDVFFPRLVEGRRDNATRNRNIKPPLPKLALHDMHATQYNHIKRHQVPVDCHPLRSHHPQLSSIQAQPPPTSCLLPPTSYVLPPTYVFYSPLKRRYISYRHSFAVSTTNNISK
jgi:hypothetical protein